MSELIIGNQNLCPFRILTSLHRRRDLCSWLMLMGRVSLQEQTGRAGSGACFLPWVMGTSSKWDFITVTILSVNHPIYVVFPAAPPLMVSLPRRTKKLRAANGLTQLWVPSQERVKKQISHRLPLFLFSSLSGIYCNNWKAAFTRHSTFYLRCCAEQAIPQINGKVCLKTVLGLKWKFQ